jgi:hypothetical protein
MIDELARAVARTEIAIRRLKEKLDDKQVGILRVYVGTKTAQGGDGGLGRRDR